jgi:glucuronoarabinoxylan endo-1,4-beta-xylanase
MMQYSLNNSTFRITLEYMDKNGILQNDIIAAVKSKKLEWTDISNLSYTIPEGATDLKLVFSTDDDEEFYLDDFYVGVDGTKPLAVDLEGTKNEVIIQGDINNDGVVDIYDMPAMRKVLINILSFGAKPTINADLNGDGDVNIADLVMLHKYLRGAVKEFKQPVPTTTTTTATETTAVSETTTVDTTSAAAASEATTETTATITTTEVTTEETSKTTTIVTTTSETETTASEPTTVGTTTEEKPSTTTKVYVNYNAQIRQDMPTNVPSNAQKSSKCKVEKKTYTCKFTGGTKSCNVILPPDYDSNKEYPVMYVLHGIGGDENSMLNGMGVQELLTGLTANGQAEDMIIVLPSQYTSKDGNGSFGINQETCAAYDNFLYDISDSLIPFIEENYPVKTGRENRAITGFSMGGREAIYIGLMRPDLFGYVGGACPAPGITPGRDMFMEHPGCMTESEMKFRDVGPEPAVFMITGGTNDSVVGSFPKEYSEILTKNGVDHVYQSIPGGGHDGGSVKPHLYTFMRYAFK